MFAASIIYWLVAALILGAVARLVLPGRHDAGPALTILYGVGGALVGAFFGAVVFGPNLIVDPTVAYAAETEWTGWLMALLGGVIVLSLVIAVNGPSRRRA